MQNQAPHKILVPAVAKRYLKADRYTNLYRTPSCPKVNSELPRETLLTLVPLTRSENFSYSDLLQRSVPQGSSSKSRGGPTGDVRAIKNSWDFNRGRSLANGIAEVFSRFSVVIQNMPRFRASSTVHQFAQEG